MDDAQCDLYLQQYFAEGTEFVLSTRLPDAEQCVAVFACEEKRQSEIRTEIEDVCIQIHRVHGCGGVFCGFPVWCIQQQPTGTDSHGAWIFRTGSALSGGGSSGTTEIH